MPGDNEKNLAKPARSSALALLAMGALLIGMVGWRTIATADVWTHIAVGRDIAAHGIPRTATLTYALPASTPWVDATWLYDVVIATLWKVGGASLITISHIAVVVLAFVILGIASLRRNASEGWALALAMALAAVMLTPVFTPGPILMGLAFVAIFIAVLWRSSNLRVICIALPLLQLIWTNLHSSFILGPILAALFAIDAVIEERRGGNPVIPATPLAILAAALFVLTLINPYGFGLHIWLIQVWLDSGRNISLDSSSAFAIEFAPTLLRHGPYVALGIIAVGLLAIRQRLSIALAGAAILGAFFLVRSTLLTPLSAALVLPFVAMSLTSLAAIFARFSRIAGAVAALVLLALGAFVITGRHLQQFGLAANVGLGVQRDAFPGEAVKHFVAKPAFPKRMLNFAADGGFLATRLPGQQIYCDTRGQLYGARFYERLAGAMLGDTKALREIEKSSNAGAILINCTWPAAGSAVSALVTQGRWALAYFDGTTAVLVRNTVDNLQFLRDRSLQKSGLEQIEAARKAYAANPGGLFTNPNCARLIGAGHVFIGLGRFQEAEIVYRLLTQGAPNMHAAWLNLGIAQQSIGRNADAIASLKRAAELRAKDPLPLLWLGRAYRATAQIVEANDAEARAKTLDPKVTEAFLKLPVPRPRPEKK